jgi:SPOR domain
MALVMVKAAQSAGRRAITALILAGGLAAQANAQAIELTAAQRRAVNAADLPRNSVVFAGTDLVVAIRDHGARSAGGGIVEGVTLQGEVTSEETAQALGYRSMRSTLSVDCVRRRDLVTRMTVYAQANAKGLAIVRQVPGDWAQPSPGAYLAAVNRAICGTEPVLAKAAPPKAASRPQPRTRAEAVEAPPPSASSGPVLAVAVDDDPDTPMTTAIEAGFRTRPTTPPPPSVEQALAAAPPSPPALRGPVSETPPKKAASSLPPAHPASPGKVAVQVAASATEAQAREALTRLKRRVPPPLSTEVRTVVVDGRTYHRAIIKGFQTRSEAQAFCASLGSECFVR